MFGFFFTLLAIQEYFGFKPRKNCFHLENFYFGNLYNLKNILCLKKN